MRDLGVSGRHRFILQEIADNEALLDHVIARLHSDVPELTTKLLFRADQFARRGLLDSARNILNRCATMPLEVPVRAIGDVWPGQMFATLGVHAGVSALLSKYRGTTDAVTANAIAWYCALSPGTPEDREAALRLAKLPVERFPIGRKHLALNTLGAALYRAGRFEEAIRQLEEGIKLRNGMDEPADWPFLAMAHYRLRHREEALRWLNRFRSYKSSDDPNQFWNELEIRLLRSEAEAVVLYDPMFPADPFSPAG
jgi:tetratricopeptide (TPR) repeat protein